MSPLPALLGSLSRVRRWWAASAAVAVAVASALALPTAHGAPTEAASSSRIGVASVSAPASAYAVLRTISLPQDGLAVGAGPDLGDAIYVASGNGFRGTLSRINPVSLAVDDTIAVGVYPLGVAVSHDDTVYVVDANLDIMSVIEGASMTVDDTIPVPDEPQAVALSRRAVDDTIFISSKGTSKQITMVTASALDDSVRTSLGADGASPWGLAIGNDDTAYITSYDADKVFRFDSAGRVVSNAVTSAGRPIGAAVSADDTVYFASQVGNAVSRFPASNPGDLTSQTVSSAQGVAVGPDGRVYVAGQSGGAGRITVVNPVTFSVDDSVVIGNRWNSIAVTQSGLVVAADRFAPSAVVVAEVAPALGASSGAVGSTGVVSIGGLPAGVLVSDTTVTSVAFDGVVAPGWTRVAGTNTISGPIPSGSGTVEVTVSLNGGNTASAGNFTYVVTPPTPPTPATAPRDVAAVAGDASASVSWAAPASSGSFAVSNYLVTSSPGGRICLTTALSCIVAGLSNGTAYTFTVKALTGAGWSAASDPSNAVTPEAAPQPTITITGSRDGDRIAVSGITIGFGMGGELKPWIRPAGKTSFTQGIATILVSMDGTFEWGRRAGKQVSVYVATPDGAVRSNTVTIGSR